MPDITVFKLEMDDPTFNAPFGGRSRSDGAKTNGSSGLSMKIVAGLGTVFLLTVVALAFFLKRRLGGNSEDSDSEEEDSTADDQSGDKDEQEKGGIRASIGLTFLIVSTAIVKRKLRAGSETARTIQRNHAA